LVVNSDMLYAPDLRDAVETHLRLGAIATMVLRPDPRAREYGSVEVDGEGRVRRLLGRPEGEPGVEGELSAYMFTGVQVLSPRAFADLPERGCIVRESYRRWVDSGEVVAGHVDDSPWRDLGTLAAYHATNMDLVTGRLPWACCGPAPAGVLVDARADVDEAARLRDTIVGAGARVGAVKVERAVIWPGATVTEGVRDAVVTTSGRVVPVGR
jgi:mannose-1-phosphate guanylyltransferase